MPPAPRDSIAQAIVVLAKGAAPDMIAPEHLPFVLEGLARVERGEFATDQEIAEAFRGFES